MIKQLNKASILDINCILGAVHSNEKKRINLGPRLLCVRDRKKPYNRDGACSTHSILSGERYRSPSTRRQFGGRRNRCTTVAMVYVPSDSFGGLSPERKGAQVLNTFFTFVAVKIVLAQLEGSSAGRGTTAGAYNPGGHKVLVTFLQDYPLKNNPDLWLGKLMKTDKMIGTMCLHHLHLC